MVNFHSITSWMRWVASELVRCDGAGYTQAIAGNHFAGSWRCQVSRETAKTPILVPLYEGSIAGAPLL